MLEEMDVDLPTDRLYHLLLDWFRSQRDVQVKDYSESEFIKVRIGHWGWRRGETPCKVNVNMEPKKMGMTHMVFDFDFSEVGAVTAITTAIALILVGVFSGLVTVFSRLVTVALCFIPLIFALLSVRQDIDKTKRRFMDRTRDFLTDGVIRVPKKEGRLRGALVSFLFSSSFSPRFHIRSPELNSEHEFSNSVQCGQ